MRDYTTLQFSNKLLYTDTMSMLLFTCKLYAVACQQRPPYRPLGPKSSVLLIACLDSLSLHSCGASLASQNQGHQRIREKAYKIDNNVGLVAETKP